MSATLPPEELRREVDKLLGNEVRSMRVLLTAEPTPHVLHQAEQLAEHILLECKRLRKIAEGADEVPARQWGKPDAEVKRDLPRLTELPLASLADLGRGRWSSAWHCEDVLTDAEARAALANHLPFGTMVERIEVRGYEAGIDGTVVLVASIYSHS